jgi:hypothetical protein
MGPRGGVPHSFSSIQELVDQVQLGNSAGLLPFEVLRLQVAVPEPDLDFVPGFAVLALLVHRLHHEVLEILRYELFPLRHEPLGESFHHLLGVFAQAW